MAAIQSINYSRGSTFIKEYQFPFSLTGCTVFFTIKATEDTSDEPVASQALSEFTTKRNSDDTVTFDFGSDGLDALDPANRYFYSLQVRGSGGTESTYVKGEFSVTNHAGKITLS